jgi:hypothetical protein
MNCGSDGSREQADVLVLSLVILQEIHVSQIEGVDNLI